MERQRKLCRVENARFLSQYFFEDYGLLMNYRRIRRYLYPVYEALTSQHGLDSSIGMVPFVLFKKCQDLDFFLEEYGGFGSNYVGTILAIKDYLRESEDKKTQIL